jgi:hypothetical protein
MRRSNFETTRLGTLSQFLYLSIDPSQITSSRPMLSSTMTRAFLLLCLLAAVTSDDSCCKEGKECKLKKDNEERICSAKCRAYGNGQEPKCEVVQRCVCEQDPVKKGKGIWKDTSPLYTQQVFDDLGECENFGEPCLIVDIFSEKPKTEKKAKKTKAEKGQDGK